MEFMGRRQIRLETSDGNKDRLDIDNVTDPIALTNNIFERRMRNQDKGYNYLRMSEVDGACPREWVIGHIMKGRSTERIGFGNLVAMNMGSALHFWLQNYGKYWGDRFVGHWRCYCQETEVLTKNRGFQLFKDVTLFDEIATLNPETDELEYHFPIAKQIFYHEGDMLELNDSRLVSLSVTPDHNMYVRRFPRREVKGQKRPFELIPASHIEKDYGFQLKKDCKWIGEVPSDKSFLGRMTLLQYVRFMAIWLSDGGVVPKDNRINIHQSSANKSYVNTKKLLEDITVSWSHQQDKSFEFRDAIIADYLSNFGVSLVKYIPSMLKSLPPEYLMEFIEYYSKADGHEDEKGRVSLYTSSDQMRDDLQEIIQKSGWSSSYFSDGRTSMGLKSGTIINRNKPNYKINIYKNKLRPCIGERYGNSGFKRVPYSGFVYDLTVPNHIMLIRRRGKTVWSGNCYACGAVRRFGIRPDTICEHCGASPRATFYKEFMYRNLRPYRVVGKIDGILKVADRYRFIEIKTTKETKLDRPIPRDVSQVSGYLKFYDYVPEDKKLPIEIDTSVGYICYFKKMFNYTSPVATFQIPKDSAQTNAVVAKAKAFTDGINGEAMPAPLSDCVRSSFLGGKSKKCAMARVCHRAHENGTVIFRKREWEDFR